MGAVQIAAGAVLIAVFASNGWLTATFAPGMLAAHGLYRLLFSSGPSPDDEDYDSND